MTWLRKRHDFAVGNGRTISILLVVGHIWGGSIAIVIGSKKGRLFDWHQTEHPGAIRVGEAEIDRCLSRGWELQRKKDGKKWAGKASALWFDSAGAFLRENQNFVLIFGTKRV